MTLWKTAERSIAKIIGGVRVPINGRGDEADIMHPWLAVEVKHRKKLPDWQLKALAQSVAAKKTHVNSSALPVVIMHEKGQRYDDSLIMLRLGDFVEHFGV